MRFFRVLRDRLRALTGRERVLDDVQSEIEHHRESIAKSLEAGGMNPDEARREAGRRFGNAARLADDSYDVRGGGLIEAFFHDLRYAVRMLRRTPAFTMAAVLTLALGIGANSAIFSVANGVLFRPLPYPDADRLAMVWMDNSRIALREDWHSFPDYADYRAQNTTFADLAIFNNTSRTVTGGGDPERVVGAHSSANLFEVLGIRAEHGRTYTAAEDQAGANTVVVLSHGLWQRRFGGRVDAIGQTLEMSGRPMKIVGVMPAGFAFPSRQTDFWIPTGAAEAQRNSRGSLWLQVVGRLEPGVSREQAQADLAKVNAGIIERFPTQKGYGVYVASYLDQMVGRIRPAIAVLIGAVAFVLLIACANVANLLLARAATRERELALRAAIGAGRGRLVRQLLTESALLGAAGGALGIGLAWVGLTLLLASAPADLPRLDAITMDGRVLGFTAGLSLLTGLIFGVAPALQLARTDPGQTLKEGGRGSSGAGRAIRRGLVMIEVALAVVLLVGAGLMIRSFDRIQQTDLGFRADHVLTARVQLWGERYRAPAPVVDFFQQVVARTEALPGVVAAGGIGTVFLSATPNSTNFSIEGRPDFPPDQSVEVPVDAVTPSYFRVMDVALRQGRFFDGRDVATAPQVVIINETMARMFWPNEDPIGRRMKYGQLNSQAPWMTIVGVVADTRRTGYDAAVRPETYLPHAQSPDGGLTLVIRTTGDPADLAPSLRAAVRAIDPGIAIQSARPIDAVLVEMTAQRRLNTILLSVFGVVAAVLAAVGIYGVIAYSVSQRARELGVRMALGATSGGVIRLVMAEGLSLAAGGVVLGLVSALALGRSMTSLLYGVAPTDPATYASIAGIAILTAFCASLVPALRAVRVDPARALGAE
jgi:putative ABC transport system permease protein